MVDRALPPSWVTFERITTERVDLYRYIPPPGENIPVSIDPFPVEDLLPTEDEIEWVVKRLRNHHYRGTSGIQDEHIKGLLVEARKEEATAEKTSATEGAKSVLRGTGGGCR